MPSTTASTPKELVRSLVGLSADLDEARRAVAERDVVRLMAVTRRRQEHAAAAVLTLESSIVREWVASQETEPRITAVEQVVQLIVGTLAAQTLAREILAERTGSLGAASQPIVGRRLLARIAAALVPHLDSTRGEALARLVEATLGRTISTREYVAVQDLATLPPNAEPAAVARHADLLVGLAEVSRPRAGLEEGARLIGDFHRAWQIREPESVEWWLPEADADGSNPVDWLAAHRHALAFSFLWTLDTWRGGP